MIIGIDPGKSGGIAWTSCDPAIIDPQAVKMPQTPRDIYDLLFDLATKGIGISVFAFIERVGPMPAMGNVKKGIPRQGIASTAKFMRHAGHLEMALIATGIPHEFVTPAVWQRNLGCLTKGDKNITKAKAQQLFPHIRVTHALADALLIAEYGRRKRS